MAKKKQRVYRLSDLLAIAEQLNARVHFQLVPAELMCDKGAPEKPQDVPVKRRKK